MTTTLPGTNAEGFMPLARVRLVARDVSLTSFLGTYSTPVIRVVCIEAQGSRDGSDDLVRPSRHLLTLSKSGNSVLRYLDEVAFLVKRPGNPFPQFISVGRSPNNDIVLGVEGVSKSHGYFTQKEGQWFVADSRSTNGTLIGDEPLAPGVRHPVASGDRIRWGDRLVTEFLTPEALYDLARAGIPS